MSFTAFNKAKLLEIAELVGGVDISSTANKADIINAIESAGITYAKYVKLTEPDLPEDEEYVSNAIENDISAEEVFQKRQVLIKMIRLNPTYEIMGHKFTKQNPFAIVSEQEAQDIIDAVDGFRMATPSEVKVFYS